ncbi:MAG: phosphate ABC transporter permease PstA [Dehalococcoidia bacterium]
MRIRSGLSRQLSQRTAFGLLLVATICVALVTMFIVVRIVVSGAGVLSWSFLTEPPTDAGRAGGIFPPIVGTFYLMLGTIVLALPIGVLSGIYLSEYAPRNWLTRVINLAIVNLAGVPSIVYGLFGLGVFVLALNFGMSLLAASLTLACQALAMTITTSREALLAIPRDYREGSLAIGATKWQTIRHVVLPQARPGIITGAVLAMSRAAGESAPILVVGAAFLVPALPQSPFDRFMALPYHLYTVATQVPGMPGDTRWGVALVLLAVVLSFNVLATIIRLRARRQRV